MRPPGEIVDLSHELFEGMPNIGGNPVSFGAIYTYEFTEELTQGRLSMQGRQILIPEHCATHLDAPRHFDREGLSTAEYPLEKLVLPGHLLDFRDKGPGEAISIGSDRSAHRRRVSCRRLDGYGRGLGKARLRDRTPSHSDRCGPVARGPRHQPVRH